MVSFALSQAIRPWRVTSPGAAMALCVALSHCVVLGCLNVAQNLDMMTCISSFYTDNANFKNIKQKYNFCAHYSGWRPFHLTADLSWMSQIPAIPTVSFCRNFRLSRTP